MKQVVNGVRIAGILIGATFGILLAFDDGQHIREMQMGCLILVVALKSPVARFSQN